MIRDFWRAACGKKLTVIVVPQPVGFPRNAQRQQRLWLSFFGVILFPERFALLNERTKAASWIYNAVKGEACSQMKRNPGVNELEELWSFGMLSAIDI